MSFRDGTRPPFTVPCEGRKARFLHRSHRESNTGPSRGSPLHYRCATQAPVKSREIRMLKGNVLQKYKLDILFLNNNSFQLRCDVESVWLL